MDNEDRRLLESIVEGRITGRRAIEMIAEILLNSCPPKFVEEYKAYSGPWPAKPLNPDGETDIMPRS